MFSFLSDIWCTFFMYVNSHVWIILEEESSSKVCDKWFHIFCNTLWLYLFNWMLVWVFVCVCVKNLRYCSIIGINEKDNQTVALYFFHSVNSQQKKWIKSWKSYEYFIMYAKYKVYEISDPFIWELSHSTYLCLIYTHIFIHGTCWCS